MKAIRVTEYGGPEVLLLQEIPLPEPGPGQARVRLRMAGVNFVDIYHRRGTYALERPFTPGREGAGVVEAVEEGVTTARSPSWRSPRRIARWRAGRRSGRSSSRWRLREGMIRHNLWVSSPTS